jgi:hypothetical protein
MRKLFLALLFLAAQAYAQPFTTYKVVAATPTLDTNAYASGDQLGTLMTLTEALAGAKRGTLESLVILDKAKQKSALVVHLFLASPTIASSDNAALDISDAQMASNYLGSVSVAAAAYIDLNASSVATYSDLGLPVEASSQAGTLYAIIESQGAPTYAASDLVLRFGFKRGG